MKTFFTTIFCCFIVTACSKKKKNEPPQGGQKVVVVKGDPMVLVKHAHMNADSGINNSLFLHGEWHLWINGFVDAARDGVDNNARTLFNDGTSNKPFPKDYGIFTSRRTASNEYTLSGYINDDLFEFVFAEGVSDARLLHVFVTVKGEKFIFWSVLNNTERGQVLHYSTRKDDSAFSILTTNNGVKGNKSLQAFNFIKKAEKQTTSIVDKVYEYLFGSGIRTAWAQKEPVTFSICGPTTTEVKKDTQEALAKWQNVLTDRLTVSVEFRNTCAPFSDLNENNFMFVDDWVEPKGITTGFAIVTPSPSNSQLIASSIFILNSEFRELMADNKIEGDLNSSDFIKSVNGELIRTLIQHTSIHEFGHSLGLHHQFNGTPSVMSYNRNHRGKGLLQYDIEAIQKLYPEIVTSSDD